MAENPQSIYSLSREQLVEAVTACGESKFRAKQLAEWLHTRFAVSWSEMSNLPQKLRIGLAERFQDLGSTLSLIEVSGEQGATQKFLGRLADGNTIETVLIPARDRATVCVSSQVGCGFHCAFCASGIDGCVRSLSIGEIVAQVVHVAHHIGRKPDNIVFMGMGEPFANYENALAAAKILNAPVPDGLGIGARHITFSTCGVVPGIERFAKEGFQFELSVSLHAPSNDLRDKLMPVNKRWNLEQLIPACATYTQKTGRIITFEYTLVAGFNDGPEHARALLKLLKDFPCRVNLIPLNPVKEFWGTTPSALQCEDFRAYLEDHGLNATLRRSKGRGIDGSCGQLRRNRLLNR